MRRDEDDATNSNLGSVSVQGDTDPKHISTSFAERRNLAMRIQMRGFAKLANTFSKKFENYMRVVALYTVCYNFVKTHKTLRMILAMSVGVSEKPWSMTDLAELVDATIAKPGLRGPYKKQKAA